MKWVDDMADTNIDYYRQREAQERAMAARTLDDMVRRLHLDLARRYAALGRAVA